MYHILLVDDEPMLKLGFRKLLEDSDYKISAVAGNGMEALSFLDMVSVDIVVTDLKMPVMDGIELIRQLKATGFQGAILVLSNYSDFELVRKALTEGACDYLLKAEITRQYLLERLDKLSVDLDLQMHEAQKNKRLLANEKQLFYMNWEAYLNGLSALSSDAKQLLFPDPSKKYEYHLILVNIQHSELSSDRKKRLMPQMKEMLLGIFNISEYILCLQMGLCDILCIVPSIACIHDMDSLLPVIQRQFMMYFNVTPLISYASSNENPQIIQRSYKMCHSALGYHFYYPEKSIFPVPEYGFFEEGSLSMRQNFWRDLSRVCKEESKLLLREALQKFVKDCCTKRVHPDWVIDLFCHFAEYRLFLSDSEPAALEKSNAIEKLRESKNVSVLIEQSVPLFFKDAIREVVDDIAISSKKEIQDTFFYMMEHYTEPVTLDDIAGYVNLNKSYLCRLFKQQTGKSVFECLNQIRMEKAAQYINNYKDKYNVKEIASMVGIEDQFYFTRRFKTYFGINPSEYAKGCGESLNKFDGMDV